MDKRIFVKKRDGYNKEALDLKYNLNIEYNLGIKDLELYIIYDIYNINEKTYELAKNSVFSEIMIDEVVEDIILQDGRYFAYETLPAQYDQRADSAVQCVSLLDNNSKITVRSGKLIIFDRVLNQDEMDKVKKYLVNPIESRIKDMNILSFSMSSEMKKMKDLKGFSSFSKDELMTLRKFGSRLQGHPDMKKLPGIEISTGSLGQGLSVANGMALNAKMFNENYRTYIVLGDGEVQEGQIWEAAMTAAHYKLDNLCAFLDSNNLQIDGNVSEIMGVEPLDKKWEAFGWNVIKIDGHDFDQILSALDKAKECKGKPTMILAKTVKGKGVSFMENVCGFHGVAPTLEELERALAELA